MRSTNRQIHFLYMKTKVICISCKVNDTVTGSEIWLVVLWSDGSTGIGGDNDVQR